MRRCCRAETKAARWQAYPPPGTQGPLKKQRRNSQGGGVAAGQVALYVASIATHPPTWNSKLSISCWDAPSLVSGNCERTYCSGAAFGGWIWVCGVVWGVWCGVCGGGGDLRGSGLHAAEAWAACLRASPAGCMFRCKHAVCI